MTFLYKTYIVEYEYIFTNKPKTLLLLHGWGGNKDSFACVKKVLRSNFNLLSISLPPNNLYLPNAECSIIPLTMYDYKQIVLNLLSLLNISAIYIICHSFGLRVSLMLATQIKIEKIVVTGGAGIKLKPNFFKKTTNNFRSIFLNQNPEYFKKFASKDYLPLSSIDRQTFKNIVNKDLRKYIKQLTCSAFLFWGNRDTATPMKMFKIFKHLKPDIEYKIIKNGNHFCYLTHNQLFIDYCDKFLNN